MKHKCVTNCKLATSTKLKPLSIACAPSVVGCLLTSQALVAFDVFIVYISKRKPDLASLLVS